MNTSTNRHRAQKDKVILEPFREAHITEEYIAWLNNKRLMQYSELSRRTHTRQSCVDYLRSFDGSSSYFWAILRADTNKHIGTLSSYVLDGPKAADMSLLIGDDGARGCGFGREAWGMAMDLLFMTKGMYRITAGTVSGNQPMERIFLHFGMTLEGVLRRHQFFNGERLDVLLYGMLRDEWLSRSSGGASMHDSEKIL
ncbi:MAG TPA: GNAT family protein [Oculatellaceae cyanobacterium]